MRRCKNYTANCRKSPCTPCKKLATDALECPFAHSVPCCTSPGVADSRAELSAQGYLQTPAKAVQRLPEQARNDHSPLAGASSSTFCVREVVDCVQDVCNEVYSQLGNCCREKTYQQAFDWELKLRGLDCEIVHLEYPIEQLYKGRYVGLRKVDLLMIDGAHRLVFEFKAVKKLTAECIKQLQFYMYKLNVQMGFLINFPTVASFPDDHGGEYTIEVVQGKIPKSVLQVKPRPTSDAQVEILKVLQV